MADKFSPRQLKFLKNYSDPKSATFGNASGSAVNAGFSKEYANNITSLAPNWLTEDMQRRRQMLDKAEKRLEKLIGSKDERVAADVSKFIAKTQGKNEGYSERTEHTGKDGKDLIPIPILNGIQSDNSDKADNGDDEPH